MSNLFEKIGATCGHPYVYVCKWKLHDDDDDDDVVVQSVAPSSTSQLHF